MLWGKRPFPSFLAVSSSCTLTTVLAIRPVFLAPPLKKLKTERTEIFLSESLDTIPSPFFSGFWPLPTVDEAVACRPPAPAPAGE